MNYIKKLINLFKTTKKENMNSIIKNLEEIKENMDNIFYDVVNDKKIPECILFLLKEKLSVLQDMQLNAEQEYKKFGENVESLKSQISLLILIMYLIGFLAIPLLGIYASLAVIVFNNILRYRNYETEEEYNKIKEPYERIIREINNTKTSCNNFVNKRISTQEIESQDEHRDESVMLANAFISDYIDKGIMNEASKEVIENVIQILQFELQSDESDLKALLEMAQAKTSEDSLLDELVRARNKG